MAGAGNLEQPPEKTYGSPPARAALETLRRGAYNTGGKGGQAGSPGRKKRTCRCRALARERPYGDGPRAQRPCSRRRGEEKGFRKRIRAFREVTSIHPSYVKKATKHGDIRRETKNPSEDCRRAEREFEKKGR